MIGFIWIMDLYVGKNMNAILGPAGVSYKISPINVFNEDENSFCFIDLNFNLKLFKIVN
mgnify:CR=1 FL=1